MSLKTSQQSDKSRSLSQTISAIRSRIWREDRALREGREPGKIGAPKKTSPERPRVTGKAIALAALLNLKAGIIPDSHENGFSSPAPAAKAPAKYPRKKWIIGERGGKARAKRAAAALKKLYEP